MDKKLQVENWIKSFHFNSKKNAAKRIMDGNYIYFLFNPLHYENN